MSIWLRCLVVVLAVGVACAWPLRADAGQSDVSKGVTLAQQGDYKAAWRFLSDVPDLESVDVGILAARAVTAAELGFVEPASRSAEALIKKSQGNVDLLVEVGEHLGREGLLGPAEKCFQKAIEIAPDSFKAWMDLAATFHAQRRFQDAVAPARRAVELQPSEFSAHYLLGSALIASGKTLEGILALRKAQDLRPDHVDLLTLLGIEYIKERYYEEAIKALRSAVEKDPNKERLRLLLISAYHHSGEYSTAYEVALEALKVFPESARLNMESGVQAEALGNLDEAERYYEKSLELDPALAQAHYYLGDLLYRKGERYEDAIKEFEKAITLAPDYADARLRLGSSLIYLGKYKEAVDALESGVTLAPDDSRFYPRLADAYGRLGQKQKALAARQTFEGLREMDKERFVRQGRPFPQ